MNSIVSWFSFQVSGERVAGNYHIATDHNGDPVVSDGWKVNFGSIVGDTVLWDFAPPKYVQRAVSRMITQQGTLVSGGV